MIQKTEPATRKNHEPLKNKMNITQRKGMTLQRFSHLKDRSEPECKESDKQRFCMDKRGEREILTRHLAFLAGSTSSPKANVRQKKIAKSRMSCIAFTIANSYLCTCFMKNIWPQNMAARKPGMTEVKTTSRRRTTSHRYRSNVMEDAALTSCSFCQA